MQGKDPWISNVILEKAPQLAVLLGTVEPVDFFHKVRNHSFYTHAHTHLFPRKTQLL